MSGDGIKAITTCTEGEDRCYNTTTTWGTYSGCMKSSKIREEAMVDNGCTTVSVSAMKDPSNPSEGCEPCTGSYPCMGCTDKSPCVSGCGYSSPSDITNCICNSDNCNTSSMIEPIIPHLAHIFVVLIYSIISRLGI